MARGFQAKNWPSCRENRPINNASRTIAIALRTIFRGSMDLAFERSEVSVSIRAKNRAPAGSVANPAEIFERPR